MAFACLFASTLVFAGSFTVPTSFAKLGDPTPVEVALVDSDVTGLEAATINITFDPVFLSFSGATAGTATSGFSVIPGDVTNIGSLAEVEVSMSTGSQALDGGSGSILDALFNLAPTAHIGTTPVTFEFLQDYAVGTTQTGFVEITGTRIPEPNTLVIFVAGLALVAFSYPKKIRNVHEQH